MSRTLEPTKKDVIDLAEYLGCNDEELWSEVSRLLKRQDTYARIDELKRNAHYSQAHKTDPLKLCGIDMDAALVNERITQLKEKP